MTVGNDQCGIVPIKCEGNKEPCTIAKPRYAILSSKDMVDLEFLEGYRKGFGEPAQGTPTDMKTGIDVEKMEGFQVEIENLLTLDRRGGPFLQTDMKQAIFYHVSKPDSVWNKSTSV